MRGRILAVLTFGLAVLLSFQSPALAGEYRFFYVTLHGEGTLIGPNQPGSLDRCNANLTSEGEFPGHFISGFDTGSGIGTYLGSYTYEATFCVGPQSPLSPQGEGTFVSADGAKIFIEFQNLISPSNDPTTINLAGPQTIVGGTGRFEGASGDQQCEFTLNLVTNEVDGFCKGVISF